METKYMFTIERQAENLKETKRNKRVFISKLSKRFNVSLPTIRRDLDELANKGLVNRTHGGAIAIDSFIELPFEQRDAINKISSSLIILIVPSLHNSFYYQIISGIERTVTRKGYDIILRSVNEDFILEKQCLEKTMGSGVNGLILIPEKYSIANIELLENIAKEMPLVLVDVAVPGFKSDLVVSDDRKGSFMVTEHLIELGHREILYLAGPQGDSSAEERILGYQDALKKYKIEFQSEFLRYTDWHTEEGYYETKKFFVNGFHKKKATAVYACNDQVAIGAFKALVGLKIKVPEDVALAGYGNLDIGLFQEVPLTSVDQSAVEMGNIAAELLLDKLSGSRSMSDRKIVKAPTKLFIRQSCGVTSTSVKAV
ncbi:MAG: DeoR/GlpR family transcriptional regulator [Candidatus Omnitrophica bacterium]|nr:DeoR/GlpR family transcriptional regulator [Candidatus Omnitrophota bacterium]